MSEKDVIYLLSITKDVEAIAILVAAIRKPGFIAIEYDYDDVPF